MARSSQHPEEGETDPRGPGPRTWFSARTSSGQEVGGGLRPLVAPDKQACVSVEPGLEPTSVCPLAGRPPTEALAAATRGRAPPAASPAPSPGGCCEGRASRCGRETRVPPYLHLGLRSWVWRTAGSCPGPCPQPDAPAVWPVRRTRPATGRTWAAVVQVWPLLLRPWLASRGMGPGEELARWLAGFGGDTGPYARLLAGTRGLPPEQGVGHAVCPLPPGGCKQALFFF